MSDARVRGEDLELRIISDGEVEGLITAITACEFEDQREIKSDGFVGERTNRKSSVYNGVRGNISLQIESSEWFDFMVKSKAKAKRETPNVQFNLIGTFLFPSGDVKQLSIPDVSFGAIPIRIASRTDWVTATLDWEASDYNVL